MEDAEAGFVKGENDVRRGLVAVNDEQRHASAGGAFPADPSADSQSHQASEVAVGGADKAAFVDVLPPSVEPGNVSSGGTTQNLMPLQAWIRIISLIMLGVAVVGFAGLFAATQLKESTLIQSDRISVWVFYDSEDVPVFYPIPYASPPDLKIYGRAWHIIRQEEKGFILRITQDWPTPKENTIEWVANGVPEPKLDPRSLFQKFTQYEKWVAIAAYVATIVASICTILTTITDIISKNSIKK